MRAYSAAALRVDAGRKGGLRVASRGARARCCASAPFIPAVTRTLRGGPAGGGQAEALDVHLFGTSHVAPNAPGDVDGYVRQLRRVFRLNAPPRHR